MDYLDKLIRLSKVEGEINTLCRFQGNWQVKHAQEVEAMGIFHIISQGSCEVILDNQEHYHLKTGDVFFLPYGLAHHIGSCGLQHCEACLGGMSACEYGAFSLKTNQIQQYDFEMFCGYVRYSTYSRSFLNLPDFLHLSAQTHPQLNALLQLLQHEASLKLPSKSIIDSLCNAMFTYLVRDYAEKSDIRSGILGALLDKRLAIAVESMLRQPEYEWNMERLAELCAMSRASFIRLFKQKTDMLPGKFLMDLRMQKAEMLLRESHKSILAIALGVGYKSEAHFSQAFKARYGMPPSQFREKIKPGYTGFD
ncbi:helix-turn-helix domain-containing protein [Conservatibacter flavescens]|uniref:HTH araC/xylS-type domain-containing protein n=1 Tax=Conservatibacter flavescens TaxID=28161 RepID=A0A2M8RZR2_9PAST|nr:AraC family transcriptional regulator [Conservatibacter flavescens]PJG84383.1 hypothetical protein CVP05_11530 [Conservatibacter flavescens]